MACPACYRQFVESESEAQGWYQDPWAIHQDRYFSQGMPTRLVRDSGRESYDLPPDRPLPAGELVPAGQAEDEVTSGSDPRRADRACDDPPYDADRVRRAVLNYFDRTAGQP